ncbi:hypothetical protein N7535_003011 [Penicillium sp. DV-2018c]|nr:hypothetical protein N7461_001301 [Penicillium sp. DV-2018c]KAJ5576085.1 hypothetical protein N7535_003011 [Penicillium sp. DV-2018c]
MPLPYSTSTDNPVLPQAVVAPDVGHVHVIEYEKRAVRQRHAFYCMLSHATPASVSEVVPAEVSDADDDLPPLSPCPTDDAVIDR